MDKSSPPTPGLPRWAKTDFWVACLALLVAARLIIADKARYFALFDSELGFVETLTFVLAIAAVFLCLHLVTLSAQMPARWLGAWFLACAVAVFLYAGEEVNWGQVWFNWDSPEFFVEYSRQRGEFNLHNLTPYLTQRLPKLLVTLAILVGGLIMPLWRQRLGRHLSPDGALYWLFPGRDTVPIAALILLTRVLERVKTWADLENTVVWDIKIKEVNEMLMAGFFVLYAWSVLWRLRLRTSRDD